MHTPHRHATGRALRTTLVAIFTTLFSLAACTMESLPRNMKLNSFNPHRPEFTCVHEADKVPPIDPMAQEWFEQGFALSSEDLDDKDRNFKAAAELWQKAAERKHWKAIINLASLYAHGAGHSEYTKFNPAYAVERDDERAVVLTEYGMKLGIPGAFDLMGTLHMEGRGVNQDASRAYAFWQLAADMGSPSAMAYLGAKTAGIYDDPKSGFWGNRKVALQMLECGMAQGNAAAAFELGVQLDGNKKELFEDYGRALLAFHSAVKFGSERAAGYLGSAFREGDPLVGNAKDPARGARYSTLGKALRLNADLRFPNLDKVLPLPPATLPKWDGEFNSLVNAAKGVRPMPQQPKSPGSAYAPNHPAHVPDGYVLQAPQGTPVRGHDYQRNRPNTADASGYWQPVLTDWDQRDAVPYVQQRLAVLRELLPNHPALYVAKGAPFQLRDMRAMDGDSLYVQWRFLGEAVPAKKRLDWLAQAGTVRAIDLASNTGCKGDKPCPQTGIWQPHVLDAEQPFGKLLSNAQLGEGWKWQAFVQEGQPMPSLHAMGIEDAKVHWRLMQMTELGFAV